MANRGIGIRGVTSQIGVMKALGGKNFMIQRNDLRDCLCYRFDATTDEADFVINRAIRVGVINIDDANRSITIENYA
jgi:hypothetical protein